MFTRDIDSQLRRKGVHREGCSPRKGNLGGREDCIPEKAVQNRSWNKTGYDREKYR